MRIKVSKSDLEVALRVAEIGVASSGADLSSHYLFRVKGDHVELLSFSQRICTLVPVKCEYDGEDGDAITVEGWRLMMWLGGIGDVAIEITGAGGGAVVLKAGRSTIDAMSLDPSKFPFWDKTLEGAKGVTSLPAERLASAFNYAKNFISDNDTARPEISQVEVLGGSVWATDKKAVTLISLPELAGSALRVHGKDISAVVKFLGLKETVQVEVLEHDRSVFFRRADGAILGASRPVAQFPTLNVAKDGDDEIHWVISKAELLSGIQCLSAATKKDNTKFKFSFDKTSGQVVLAVEAVNGKENTHDIPCIEQGNAADLPDDGFWIDFPYITRIAGHFAGESLKFGINKKKKNGYVRFHHVVGSDDFLTVVVWRV